MAGRIATLILRIRDSLSDHEADRWSNDRIIRLIDEAQTDIVIKAKLLRAKVEIPIIADISTYSLPSKATTLTRVITTSAAPTTDETQDRSKIPIVSHDQMDSLDSTWETRVGDGIERIVFDKLNKGQFKVYPIPSIGDTVSAYVFTADEGVITDVTEDTVDAFGVTTDLTTTATLTTEFSSDFGVVTDMSSAITSILVYYLRRPTPITDYAEIDASQHLEISLEYDKAIKHYVVGMALRDDKDTQNRTMGNEELLLYVGELKIAAGDSGIDFTAAPQREAKYNTGFDL